MKIVILQVALWFLKSSSVECFATPHASRIFSAESPSGALIDSGQKLPSSTINQLSSRTLGSHQLFSMPLSSADACTAFLIDHQEEQDAMLKRDRKVWIFPTLCGALGFTLFPETITGFHRFLEIISLAQYKGELSEDIRPLINGPVTLTISILFGSLVSMTISTLYQRQTELHRVGIQTVNECRHMQYLSSGLPEPERSQIRGMIARFSVQHLTSFFRGDLHTSRERRTMDLAPMILLLNQVERRGDGGCYLSELYGSLSIIKESKTQYTAAIQKNFTPAHYANLMIQAFSLLLIYLWETDDPGLMEAHAFELRIAWAMLLSTIASLAAIIADLNTPISNIITMVRKHNIDMKELMEFTLAKDLDWTVEKADIFSPAEKAKQV